MSGAAVALVMPAEFKGEPEAAVWDRLVETRPRLGSRQAEALAAYCRAFVDEAKARAEMVSAIEGGDAGGARQYGALVKEMRAQAQKILEDL